MFVTAEATLSPPRLVVRWSAEPRPQEVHIRWRTPWGGSWSPEIPIPADETSCEIPGATSGGVFDVEISQKLGAGSDAYSAYGHIRTGIATEASPSGRVLLVVRRELCKPLATEIERLERDLRCEGWGVQRIVVEGSDDPRDLRERLLAEHRKAPTENWSVLLLGHVPVPYSGNLNPDGHSDHRGAWPADVYYGVPAGEWTDTEVKNATGSRPETRNIPGDGKFDQSLIPGQVRLAVGRVDFSEMPAFAPLDEISLTRRYLDKNHAFRTGAEAVERRVLVDDRFGDFRGEAFAVTGWRAGATLFGKDAVVSGSWFGELSARSYLWAYGCGPGSYTSAGGIGGTADFVAQKPRAVFTLLFGSYFGDWNVKDSFLRAPLASAGLPLTCGWAGRPHWLIHPMGLGATIGECLLLTQNNGPRTDGSHYRETGAFAPGVHIALMGDPTLRLLPRPAPATASAQRKSKTVQLSWATTPGAIGYHVYRSGGPGLVAPLRLTRRPVSVTRWMDAVAPPTGTDYLVRPLFRELGPAGEYSNPGRGILATVPPATPVRNRAR